MRLPADTGGKALLDYNDLAKGIVQAQQAISSYYMIGLLHDECGAGRQIPPHQDFADYGRCRPISITARAISPANNSASSPPPIKSGSSKTR